MHRALIAGAGTLGCVLASPAFAQEADSAQPILFEAAATQGDDLSGLSIEQLARIEVRSASKREQPLSSAPAALYVITWQDIEFQGLTTLPEALRLAPNLNVQRVDASQYSIAARGFNGIQAGNKLLALIDGRTIYTPLGSSVFWQLHAPMVEDLQQIEVISGPGGTLYGPNAVNGVISITTRDAQDTLGTAVRGTAGTHERTAALRHGIAIGSSGAVRVYGNWRDTEGFPRGTGVAIDDNFRGWQAGFRSDFVSDATHLTLQGDIFRNDADTLPGDGAKGHNLLARWSRTLSPTSSVQIQGYYDKFKRDVVLVDDLVSTMDAEGQFNATVGRHNFIAGLGARTTRDEFINELNFFQLNPSRKRLWVFNGFVQDQLALTDQLSLIAGVKVERSTFSGWQVLPNIRVAWQPDERNLLWGAVSRAVRTPSRIDRQLEAPPFLVAAPGFQSEKLVAVEAGYRGQPSSATTLSLNAFLNFYRDLRTTEFIVDHFELANGYKGKTYGLEAWGTAQVLPGWRASLGLATLWKDLSVRNGHNDLAPRNSLGNDPEWHAVGRSDIDVAPRLQLSLNARAVGRLDRAPEVRSYFEAGGQLAYRLTNAIDVFVAGQNLLHRSHAESNDPNEGQLARRSIYVGTRARF
jgi:iron complex outermembrane receptor protein